MQPVRQCLRRNRRLENTGGSERDGKAHEPSGDCQNHRLDEELTNHPRPARAERSANGHLSGAEHTAADHQVCSIRARHQHDQDARGDEWQPCRMRETAKETIVNWDNARGEAVAALRMVTRDSANDRLDVETRIVRRHVLTKSSKDTERADVATVSGEIRQLPQRQPYFRGAGKTGAIGHHANHGCSHAVDEDRAAENAGIGRVARLPDTSRQQNEGTCALGILVGGKCSAQDWRCSDDLERAGGHVCPFEPIRCVSLIAHRKR
jgi:hypothetical protein